MASVSVLNSIGTVVHNSPDKAVSVLNSFGTVVHNTPATLDAVSVLNSFGTVVHNIPPALQSVSVQNMFGTTVHNSTFVFNVSDITGTVGTPATFDASTQGLSTASFAHEWSWVSVPAGSSYANQSILLPDGGANTYFDMTDNQGLWHFEGNADDTSGNGNNGTVSGATLVAGRVGNEAYLFNGSSDYITAPSALSLQITGNISIAAWIKANGYAQWGSIIQYSNPSETEANNYLYNIAWANGSGDVRLFWEYGGGNNVTTDFATNLDTGRWYHIVVVRDNLEKEAYLYVDGELFGSQTYSNNPTGGSTAQLWIGKDPTTGVHFDGTIDEVAIWDRTLSSSEVHDLFFLQSGSAASGSAPGTNLDDEFTFTPDVEGTYTINLNFYQYSNGASENGDVDAVISPSGPGVITGSNPTTHLITSNETGYSINTYSADLLTVQRARTVKQIPFKLGGKGIQSLRLRLNTDFTGSS
tara:strand:+ start:425 stop:1837 length:1413 start_codon:yes stop_codon:yes gene_type:complete